MDDPLFWLYADNYRTYNVEVARKLGSINAAIYLSELCQRHKYHRDRNEFISDEKHGDGWFYYTAEKCEERTAMNVDEQRNCYNSLKRLGLIEQVNFGIPCKKHFRLNIEKILDFFGFSKNISSCGQNPNWMWSKPKLDVVKTQTAHYIEEPKEEPEKDLSNTKKNFGKFVKLSEEEHQKLIETYGTESIKEIIDKMNDYCASTKPQGYKDYAAAIRQWMRNEKEKQSKNQGVKNETVKQSIHRQQIANYESGGQKCILTNVLDFSKG
jgi:hypothetical protein